jgi:hypothetical protein
VDRTSLKGKEYSQTPMDYKSIELDYNLLQGDYKSGGFPNAGPTRRLAASLNKIPTRTKTIRKGGQDLIEGKSIQPNTNGLQNH